MPQTARTFCSSAMMTCQPILIQSDGSLARFWGESTGYESVDALGCCEVLAETKSV